MVADRAPLLLLPGMLCDGRVFAPQIQSMGCAGDRSLVCDLTQSSTIAGMAARVLDTAPPSFSLAGLSLGGIVAIEICRQAPERVLRLALLDTSTLADTPERRQARQLQVERARRGDLESLVRDDLAPRYFSAANRRREDLLRIVVGMAMAVGPDAFLRQAAAVNGRQDTSALLSRIRCPTLVLCGDADELCPPAHHAEIAAALPCALLRVISECGHLSTLEQPEAVSAALGDWLNQPCGKPVD
jgi:pimeloyl-ACP methyl ester carboxylesterase